MKGRKPSRSARPLPSNVKLITPSEPKLDDPPKPPEPPPCPDWLPEEAKVIWHRIAPEMAQDGIWKPYYADCLASYCSLLTEYQRDPYAFSAAKLTQLRQFMQELAITPASERNVVRARSPAGRLLRR